jgi:riboflavin kinase/FMN adenylyltransferase
MSMRIFEGLENVGQIKNPVVTIGTFDGVHIGHQKIIQQLILEAKKIDGESVLITFHPHPRLVLFPDNHNLQLLQTQAEKLQTLAENGLENVIILPFSKEFAQLSALDFVQTVLYKSLKAKKIIIGYDHQFGNDRKGNIDFLITHANDFNYDVIEIPAEEINEVNVSSTKIRTALQDGSVEIANAFLNKPFELSGTVIKGEQLGRTIGFPTANLDLKDNTKLIPANGVYAVKVQLQNEEKPYFGMMNIGYRPTVSLAQKQSIEIYLFDFHADLYEAQLKVSLYKRIRKEEKFVNLATLKSQLSKDEALIRSYFSIISNH